MSLLLATVTADGVLATLAYALVGAALLAVGTGVLDLATPGPLLTRLRQGSANAAALIVGNLVAVTAIVVAAGLSSPDGDLGDGLASMAVYGALGIAAQALLLVVAERGAKADFDRLLQAAALEPMAVVVSACSVALGAVLVVAVV